MTDLGIDFPPDPPRYAFFAGSILVCGTLDTYARAWADRQYADSDNGLSREILLWPHPEMEPRKVIVNISHESTDEEDFMHYKISVPGDVAWASVGGRA